MDTQNLNWEKGQGLVPAIVQDVDTLQVLMLGYMNEDAWRATLESGKVTFFSRSRQSIWRKGETSGNTLDFISAEADCDRDTLLITARPAGPVCHRNTTACFNEVSAPGLGFLGKLNRVITKRFEERPEKSYTSQLFDEGLDRIAQKVGEEAIEIVIASKNQDKNALTGEIADLVFHLLVLMKSKEVELPQLIHRLRERHEGSDSNC